MTEPQKQEDEASTDGTSSPGTKAVTTSYQKVIGETDQKDAVGVLGRNTNGSTATYGVIGETHSTASGSAGIRGDATASNFDPTYGVHGVTTATDFQAAGVFGEGDSAHGVKGTSTGAGYNGVMGEATTTTGWSYGVRGNTASSNINAAGVFGRAQNGSGTPAGVWGKTSSVDAGAGVRGEANNASGQAYGVHAVQDSPDSPALYATGSGGGAIEGSGRLIVKKQLGQTGSGGPENHVANIVDTKDDITASVLSLKVGYTSDPVGGNNFITFFDGNDNPVGSIEGNGSGGAVIDSGSADYAEYLPKRDPEAELEPGDVVGVYGDEISLQTDGAQHVLVVTGTPIIAGNSPRTEDREGYETVGFTGQVAVRVRGTVDAGDVIVPSGEEDGTATAISPPDWTPGTKIVGQAWEADDSAGVSTVNVAIGIDDPGFVGEALESSIADLRDRLTRKDRRLEELAAEVEALREEKAELRAEKETLRQQVTDIDERVATLEGPGRSPASADD